MDNQLTTFNTGVAELLFIKTDYPKVWVDSTGGCKSLMIGTDLNEVWDNLPLPEGNGEWQLLGDPFTLTNEQWQRVLLCGYASQQGNGPELVTYIDYEKGTHAFVSAVSSALSLLNKLEVYAVNPYEQDFNQIDEGFSGYTESEKEAIYHHYEHAQSRTGKWVVLAKMKENG
jgi:hypothetical protein